MMIARRIVSGACLAAVASIGFAGCAEDNDKNMMKGAAAAPPTGVPAPSGEIPTPPPGNDPEARKAYEMKRQADMYKNYPGYNTKGR